MMKKQEISLLKLLWKMILYRPWLYLANIILWTLIYTYSIIPSLLIRRYFNILSEQRSSSVGLIWILALIIGAALGRVVIGHFGGVCDIINKFSVKFLIGRNMLEAILKKPGAKAIPVSSGEALNCFRDDLEQAEITLSWLLDTIGTTVFAVIALIILVTINPLITLFVFAPLVIVVVLAKKASTKIEKHRRESRKTTSNIIGMLGEVFGAVQGVKVSGAEKNIINHIKGLNKKRHKAMLKDVLFTQIFNSVYHSTISLGTGLILLMSAHLMKAGSFSIGDFALFVYYLAFVAEFTMVFGDFMAFLKQTEVSFERMAQLIETDNVEVLVKHNDIYLKGDIPKPDNNIRCQEDKLEKLEIKNLSYRYPKSSNGIDDISFDIKKGSFTVITGRIGSGKTTLLRAILGLLPSQGGTLYWNDKRIDNPDCFLVPPRASYTSQVPNLFSDTLEENILLGADRQDDEIDKAIYHAVLDQDIFNLEKGVETVVGPRGVKLSGGQIQRVAAARMFYRNSQLVVFDDISSALDIDTENALWNRLFKRKDITCLVVSNKKAALQRADHIIVMKGGRVEAQGNLEKLIENCDEFRQIWGMEMEEGVVFSA